MHSNKTKPKSNDSRRSDPIVLNHGIPKGHTKRNTRSTITIKPRSAGSSPISSPILNRITLNRKSNSTTPQLQNQNLRLSGSPTSQDPVDTLPPGDPAETPPNDCGTDFGTGDQVIAQEEVDIESCQTGDKDAEKKKKGKQTCPCGKSSSGQCWLLPCPECKQVWHNVCAGLKGEFTKPVLNSLLKSWQCPWCFVCPFPRPKNHSAPKRLDDLRDKLFTSETMQQISESVTDIIEKNLQLHGFEKMQETLNQLSLEIQDFKNSIGRVPSSNSHELPSDGNQETSPSLQHVPHPVNKVHVSCTEKPFVQYTEDFLTADCYNNVKTFLDECVNSGKFIAENGRSVLTFGQYYPYNGSRSPANCEDIPQQLKPVVEKIAKDLELKNVPNSILINHYPSSANSSLPFHSDDEDTILADSKIVTLTLGTAKTITFKPLHSSNEGEMLDLTPAPNSIYSMTRSSQNWFKHGIHANNEAIGERFSITFRLIDPKFKRSVLVIGDSNTKDIAFGAGKGKVGESFPGKRIKAARINDIRASDCIGYSHVIIACGTNDLRPENTHHHSQIHKLVSDIKFKILQIKTLCPYAKINLMPVLPTRNPAMNSNVVAFNELVLSMLGDNFQDVWHPGLYSFVDRSGLLSIDLTRANDSIHLNGKGIAKLVSLVKLLVYKRECENRPCNVRGNQRPPPGPS